MSNDEAAVRKLVATVAKDHNYTNYECEIKQITTGGANYTSYLYQIKVSQENRDDLFLFAKVAAFGEEIRKSIPMEEVYYLEIYFYQTVGRIFKSFEQKHNVPDKHRLNMSNLYACSKEPMKEILIMDDLSKMGYQSFDRFKALGWDEMTRIVDELAKFHALSFAFGHKFPEEYAEAKKNMKFNLVMQENSAILTMWRSMLTAAKDVLDEKNMGPFTRFIDFKLDDGFANFVKESKKLVFIHGDYRPSNLMYKTDESGKMEVIILDYQTLRSGSVILDLMYLIFTSTDQKFRKLHYQALLEYYYSQLEQALQRLGVQPDQVYSKEEYQQELQEQTIMGLAASAFVLQLVLVEESDAPKVDGNLNMESFMVKSSSLFKKRFNEIVEDYINWGVIE